MNQIVFIGRSYDKLEMTSALNRCIDKKLQGVFNEVKM
ncbi:hypothetical protein [Lacrimispora xylanisolvens]